MVTELPSSLRNDSWFNFCDGPSVGDYRRRWFPMPMNRTTAPTFGAAKRSAIATMVANYAEFARGGIFFILMIDPLVGPVLAQARGPIARLQLPGLVQKAVANEISSRQSKPSGRRWRERALKHSRKVAFPYHASRKSGSFAPPTIKVDNGIIVDGNHRHVAGRVFGKAPSIQPWEGGRPNGSRNGKICRSARRVGKFGCNNTVHPQRGCAHAGNGAASGEGGKIAIRFN
jgi:hypothetical protein